MAQERRYSSSLSGKGSLLRETLQVMEALAAGGSLEETRARYDGHEEIGGWSPQTRSKVASNYLTIARDFGLLEGTQRKVFTRLYVPLPTFVYALYRLKGEGQPTKAIVTSDDFKLFLMDQRDIYRLLDEATRAGYVTFQRAGDVCMIYGLRFTGRGIDYDTANIVAV